MQYRLITSASCELRVMFFGERASMSLCILLGPEGRLMHYVLQTQQILRLKEVRHHHPSSIHHPSIIIH
jgi:hypothetical protein